MKCLLQKIEDALIHYQYCFDYYCDRDWCAFLENENNNRNVYAVLRENIDAKMLTASLRTEDFFPVIIGSKKRIYWNVGCCEATLFHY